MLYAIFHHIFMCLCLLLEHMGLHLIDRRFHFHKTAQVNQTVRVEIRYTDSANPAFLICFFHCPVSSIIVIERLVDKHQINIFRLQLTQGFLQRSLRFFIATVADPYFCGDK